MARGGFRPGSGRKSLDEEYKRFENVVRCFEVVMEYVNSDAPLKDRAELAAKIAVRCLPERIEHSGPEGSDLRIVQLLPPYAQNTIDAVTVPSDQVPN